MVAQAIGLFFGLLVCRRVTRNVGALTFCALVLAAWMFPRHKLFEPAIAMAAVWMGVRLIESPSSRRLFEVGAFTGLVAWFGRNHGLYCGLAFTSMIALLGWKGQLQSLPRALVPFVFGGIVGSAPLWLMLLVVPGFASAFIGSIAFNLTQGVNLPLPYPWPWTLTLAGRSGFDLLAAVATSAMFALPVLMYPLVLAAVLRTPREKLTDRAPMIAAALVGVFVMHHVSVRSDIAHLAQAIHPLLLLWLVLPAGLSARPAVRMAAFGALGVATFVVTLDTNPSLAQLRPGPKTDLVVYNVLGDGLRVSSVQAAQLTGIDEAIRSRLRPGESLFIAPSRPGLYPIFDRKSPDWWLYFLWPASDSAQQQTIERLESSRVGWALVVDEGIDGKDELRFRNSNAKVWEYLNRSFVDVGEQRLPPNHVLLQRRAP